MFPAAVAPAGSIEWVAIFTMLPLTVRTGCCEVWPFIINKSLYTVVLLFEAILKKGTLADWIKNKFAGLTPTLAVILPVDIW